MTTAQTQQLAASYADYTAKKNDYDSKVSALNTAQSLPPSPANGGVVANAKVAVNAAKSAMDAALAAYNTLKDDLAAQDQAAFIAANPNVAVDIATAQVNAQTQAKIETAKVQAQATADAAAAKAKTDLEAQAATFASKNKQMILYVSIALVVVIIGVTIFLKFRGKKQP